MKILLVDDDRDLTDLLTFVLHRAAFRVVAAHDPATAIEAMEAERPDLVLLDARLGASNGFDLLKEIRRFSQVPVIMLTAMSREDDKVLAFQLGADDYITKPFSHRELVARIHARLRSPATGALLGPKLPAALKLGSLSVNANDYTVERDGRPLKLTATEFRLLHCLLAQAGSVVPTAMILRQVWGYDDPSVRDSLRVTAYRLRRKIEDDPANPRLLHTIPGIGFLLKSDVHEGESLTSPQTQAAVLAGGIGESQGKSGTVVSGRTRPRAGRTRPRRTSQSSGPWPTGVEATSLERRTGR